MNTPVRKPGIKLAVVTLLLAAANILPIFILLPEFGPVDFTGRSASFAFIGSALGFIAAAVRIVKPGLSFSQLAVSIAFGLNIAVVVFVWAPLFYIWALVTIFWGR